MPNLVHVLGKHRIETRSFTWVEGCVPGYKKGDMPEKERGEIQRTSAQDNPCHYFNVPAATFSSFQDLEDEDKARWSFTTVYNRDHIS